MKPRANCSLVEHWIYLSLDGELSDELEKQLELHLDECVECRRSHEAAARQQELLEAEFLSISSTMDDLLRDQLAEDRLLVPRVPERRGVFRALGWPLAAAACVLVLVGWALLGGLDSGPDGNVVAQFKWGGPGAKLGSEELGAAGERALHFDEWLRVPSGVRAVLEFPDGTVLRPLGATRCALVREADGSSVRVELARGGLDLDVARAPRRFSVVTEVARVEVLGTRFLVQHDATAPQTRVEVREGMVSVQALGTDRQLELGVGETCRVFRARIASGEWQFHADRGEWGPARTKQETHNLEHGRAASVDEAPVVPVHVRQRPGAVRQPLDLPMPDDDGLEMDFEDDGDGEDETDGTQGG